LRESAKKLREFGNKKGGGRGKSSSQYFLKSKGTGTERKEIPWEGISLIEK